MNSASSAFPDPSTFFRYWTPFMSHVGALCSELWHKITTLVQVEALRKCNDYKHTPVEISHTIALYRALSWWEDTADYYYARARWIVFIIVLVYWNSITASSSTQTIVAHQGVEQLGVRSNETRPRYHLKAFVTRTRVKPSTSAVDIDKDEEC
jgi:hypothetical protein